MRWAFDVIDRQLYQMTRIIDDLLDISRITYNRLEVRKDRVLLSRSGVVQELRLPTKTAPVAPPAAPPMAR